MYAFGSKNNIEIELVVKEFLNFPILRLNNYVAFYKHTHKHKYIRQFVKENYNRWTFWSSHFPYMLGIQHYTV